MSGDTKAKNATPPVATIIKEDHSISYHHVHKPVPVDMVKHRTGNIPNVTDKENLSKAENRTDKLFADWKIAKR